MKSAIVSGATGLVGSAVIKELAYKGVKVLALGRQRISIAAVENNFGSKVTYLNIRLDEISSLPERIRKETSFQVTDCVFFHFAWSGERRLTDGPLSLQLSNAANSADVIELAKEIGCKKVVTAGTIQETRLELFLNGEASESSPISQQDYALAKLAARDMSKITAYLQKIDFVHTRMSVPLDFSLVTGTYIAQTLQAILLSEPYSEPASNEVVDIVSTEDVAKAYYLLGSSEVASGDFYVGSSRPMRIPNLFTQVEDAVAGRAVEFAIEETALTLFDPSPLKEAVGFSASKRLEDILRDWGNR